MIRKLDMIPEGSRCHFRISRDKSSADLALDSLTARCICTSPQLANRGQTMQTAKEPRARRDTPHLTNTTANPMPKSPDLVLLDRSLAHVSSKASPPDQSPQTVRSGADYAVNSYRALLMSHRIRVSSTRPYISITPKTLSGISWTSLPRGHLPIQRSELNAVQTC